MIFTIFVGGIVAASTETGSAKNQSIAQWVKVDGMDTLLAEKHDRPILFIDITFPVGGYFDPVGKEGLANLMGDMLLRGTQTKTREEIENTLDYLGATLQVSTGFHSMALEGQVLSRNLTPFLDLVIEILSEPTFPEEELKKLKEETIAQLYLRLEDDAQLARLNFTKALFDGHPYSRDPMGSLKSIQSLTRQDVADLYKKHIHRGGLLIGGAGDLTRKTLEEIAHKLAVRLPAGRAESLFRPFGKTLEGREIVLVDKPERTQTQFLIGQPGIGARDPDFFKLNVFMTAFGGHLFQARYMQEIRVKRGWSYGAYGYVDGRRDGGAFYLYTFPKVVDTLPALTLSLELFQKAIDGEMTDAEIEFAKKHLTRSFPFLIDTPEKVVSQRIYQRLLGRADDYLETYVANIEAVTPAQARAAAKARLNTKNMEIVILCTAKDFKEKIGKELGAKSVRVVPYDEL